MICVMYCHYCV